MNVNIGRVTDVEDAVAAIEDLVVGIREDAEALQEQLRDAEGERDLAQRRVEELESE
jgi:hypothetical protein